MLEYARKEITIDLYQEEKSITRDMILQTEFVVINKDPRLL